ncbi:MULTISPECIES: hypothetical protein [unclassified Bosea (in: a-proteobacteria)]|uniref:hypothetical protein n=1 Tax=unclassified Bosea (in: a-proteobacteria) TaxID=2653178 RepID=UPI000F751DBC|nr:MULTISPECIES: hypothetical protein [unclassified Bosea (in: a-proteobacteria)]AZO78404.1 hypothetical protein BLM15_12845 [Bosea sp. Tri-49]RXT20108.1 hypothetical protein B5U98_19175 [Bosea sp. Tri-39]RXT36981.1 hypothetical protein B5U99_13495 [Bosea sp. Tri-54]
MQTDDETTLPFWRQRPRPIGFEIAYRLKGDTLEVDSTRKVDQVRLSAVEQVRFIYAPSNVSSKGFRTQLRLSDGRTITFGNLSWRSLTDIDRDDTRYHAFVTALSAAIVRANPKARFLAGNPYLLWLALALAGSGAMVMLTFFSLRAFQQGATAAAGLGLVLAAASFWQVWPMIKLNRPRELAAGEVPDDLVPGRQPG